MPRKARIRHAGVPQHVIQRGNNRTACFFADEDYRTYLGSFLRKLGFQFTGGNYSMVLPQ